MALRHPTLLLVVLLTTALLAGCSGTAPRDGALIQETPNAVSTSPNDADVQSVQAAESKDNASQSNEAGPKPAKKETGAEPAFEVQTLYTLKAAFQGASRIVETFEAPAGTFALDVAASVFGPGVADCLGAGHMNVTGPDGQVWVWNWECSVGGSCILCDLDGKAGPGPYTVEIVFVGTMKLDLRIDALVA